MRLRQSFGIWFAAAYGLMASMSSACSTVLTPEETEGPFFYNSTTVRRNITENNNGIPLQLQIRIVNPNDCSPIEKAAIDIWHCDTVGVYSHFTTATIENKIVDNTTFLRGIQLTDSNGLAVFDTIFPGWYSGRTVHIHLKVHIGGTVNGSIYSGGHVSHTGQLFFTDNLVTEVALTAPYDNVVTPRTLLSQDEIYNDSYGSYGLLNVTGTIQSGLVGTVSLGVDVNSVPSSTSSGGGGPSKRSIANFWMLIILFVFIVCALAYVGRYTLRGRVIVANIRDHAERCFHSAPRRQGSIMLQDEDDEAFN